LVRGVFVKKEIGKGLLWYKKPKKQAAKPLNILMDTELQHIILPEGFDRDEKASL
jgi:hypothetical protein